jgi:hypothetical protein
MNLRTYVHINYFDCLHVRNSFLNLCRVFLKHPVCIYMALAENYNVMDLKNIKCLPYSK